MVTGIDDTREVRRLAQQLERAETELGRVREALQAAEADLVGAEAAMDGIAVNDPVPAELGRVRERVAALAADEDLLVRATRALQSRHAGVRQQAASRAYAAALAAYRQTVTELGLRLTEAAAANDQVREEYARLRRRAGEAGRPEPLSAAFPPLDPGTPSQASGFTDWKRRTADDLEVDLNGGRR